MKTICGSNSGNTCGCGTKIIDQCNPQISCDNNTWPVQVLSKNGQEFYPLTHTKAIVSDDCQTLDDVFRNIDSKINTQILDVNVNVADSVPITLNIDDDGICRLNPAWIASQHKAIRLISEDPSQDEVIVYMDRADTVPVLNKNGNLTYNSDGNIVAITNWRFVYGGYEYIISSSCDAKVQVAAEGGAISANEVVREDVDGNKRLQVTNLGKAIIPLVTETDSGLITAQDYKKLKTLIDILNSHDPINHTIVINGITYQLNPVSDRFLWTNDQNWDDNNKWE